MKQFGIFWYCCIVVFVGSECFVLLPVSIGQPTQQKTSTPTVGIGQPAVQQPTSSGGVSIGSASRNNYH